MRSNWPIAFSLAACAHAGVVASLAARGGLAGPEAPTIARPLEVRISFVDSPVAAEVVESAVVPTPPVSPQEAVAVATADVAMPAAESAPATANRARIVGTIGAFRKADVRRDVASLADRASDRSAAVLLDLRTVADGWFALAQDIRGRLPAIPNRAHLGAPSNAGVAGANAASDFEKAGPSGPVKSVVAEGLSGAFGSRGPVAAGGNQPPAYPVEAARRRVEGVAVVVARVGVLGAVVETWIDRSSGSTVLDDAALVAVRRWHFAPAVDTEGAGVECEARVPIEFRLRSR